MPTPRTAAILSGGFRGVDLDFLKGRYAVNGSYSSLLPSAFSYTRAGTGTATTNDTGTGIVLSFPTDVPRIAPGRGQLLESSRTNLLLRSQERDNASWGKNSATVTADAVAAPDGTTTADKLIEAAATNIHFAFQTMTLTGSTVYTVSDYVKAGERSRFQLAGAGSVWGSSCTATFDLASGALVSSSGWTATSVTALASGWFRCTATGTTAASPTAAAQAVQSVLIQSGTTQSYLGDGTSGIYPWGAQLEPGSVATSYVPTAGATATCGEDEPRIAVPSNCTAYIIDYEGGQLTGAVTPLGTFDYSPSALPTLNGKYVTRVRLQ